jgi:hypothetical protein
MLHDEFFHDLLRKYVVVFGTLFNNIKIARTNTGGDKVQEIKVPISYAPRQKFIARLEGEPEGRSPVAITLPRMSFEMLTFNYAADRKTNSLNQMINRTKVGDRNVYKQVWNPVPYDITFQLNIIAKTVQDGSKIVEQILPFFTPDWTVSAKLLEDMDNVILDIPVVLSEVTMTDAYDGLFTERRALIWTLTFTMKAWFFGPVRESKIIKVAKVNLYPTMDKFANTIFDRVILTPGLTETGEPTAYSTDSIVQCLASAAINNAGEVEEITVDQSGIGYSGASITVGPAPLGGRTATAKPVITHGVLDKIVVTDKGSGYTSIPYVTVSTPDLASIPYIEIDENDDFGFVVTIEEREK